MQELEFLDQDVLALAEAVSLAVRVEPPLMRRIRLELLPEVSAGTEADLWFSPLVDTRSALAIVLKADCADALRARLREKPALLDASWKIVEELHRGISPAVLLEERLAYLALAGKEDEMQEALRSVVAAMVQPRRRGLAGWAARALSRLPADVRNSEEAQMLAFGASLRLGELVHAGVPAGAAQGWASWLSPGDLQTTAFGVALVEGGIEFGPPGRSLSNRIELPRTNPIVVELEWDESGKRRLERVVLASNELTTIDTGPEVQEIDIRTVLGDVFTLQVPVSRRESTQHKLSRLRPPRVHITYDVEIGDAIEKKEIPFVVGVLGDWCGDGEAPRMRERRFVPVDADNLDAVIASFRPRLSFGVRNVVNPKVELSCQLQFQSLSDFEPAAVARQLPWLSSLEAGLEVAIDPVPAQLREVIHHPRFQALEATWRGLNYLVNQTESSEMLKIRILHATKDDLLPEEPDFREHHLFKKIYEEEFGIFGGEPFGLLVGAFEFDSSPDDLRILKRIASIAAAAHAPFAAAASPRILGLSSYLEAAGPQELTVDPAWNELRDFADSRYIALTLPRVLLRLPYGKDTVPVPGIDFEELLDATSHDEFLWGNAAFAFAARVTNAFAKYEWCAAIRGVEGGGLVEGLPAFNFMTDEGDVALKCPTEIALTDVREHELAQAGFLPLVHCRGTDYAAFFSSNSVCRVANHSDEEARANAACGVQLPYLFAVSRFVHFLKCAMRDKIGSFMSREQAEMFLNQWIMNYVLLDDNASVDTKARFPLREARIDVIETTEKSGDYTGVAFLRPHFQLDDLTVSLRVAFDLPRMF
ncbi:MAG: type VI secretion system contractile sheath large subunit [Bryobacterales bacterium]|nr:type VI secretion system contractile sheath large subunit [Bryobacterales bacterium]